MKKLTVLIAIMLLAGCAAGGVGYGNPSHVIFQTEDRIKIMWDVLLESEEDVAAQAQEFCAERRAELVDVDADSSSGGLVRTHTFKCTES